MTSKRRAHEVRTGDQVFTGGRDRTVTQVETTRGELVIHLGTMILMCDPESLLTVTREVREENHDSPQVVHTS